MTVRTLPSRLAAGRIPWLVPALAACYLIWGSTYYAVSVALQSFPPFFQMGTRFLAASALLLAWALWRGTPWPRAREWRDAAIAGALLLVGGMGLLACAERYVSSSLAAAMMTLEPLLICLMSTAFGWRPTRRELIGIGLGITGVILLASGSTFRAEPLGLVLLLISSVAWSLGSVLSARRLRLASGAMGHASQMFCGALGLMAVSAILGEKPGTLTPAAFAAWSYLVIAGSIVAFGAYMYLLRHASPSVASSNSYVNPAIALAIGTGLAGETVTYPELLGIGTALAGVMLLLGARR